ncbi:MAG TPA: alanine racemase [Spongiibacteraceae bacterium]|nr:alanine racemase [Spongiibacteraceae bacterium]
MYNTALATIDLAALRHNLHRARALAPGSKLMAMIKANGYGHGLLPVARALSDADGLAVARLDEAVQLREQGLAQRLLLLGTLLDDDDLALCAQHHIDIVIHEADTARRLARARLPRPVHCWLKLDTGMHRLGLMPGQLQPVLDTLAASAAVGEQVLMTHFACADEVDSAATAEQLACFAAMTRGLGLPTSLANSAALIDQPASHGDWNRPGIMLYGDNPLHGHREVDVRPVMTLSARVLAVRDIPPGAAVGYGATWISRRPSRIATVGIGYGDGYPRHAPNGTPVLVNGHRAALAGRVSMDSICVDVTDCGPVSPGDPVELWGRALPAREIADHAGTISYALFTGISQRVEFVYEGLDVGRLTSDV